MTRRPGSSRPGQISNKERGAYYTDQVVAGFLIRWAVASAHDVVIDPSFGNGAFLKAAAERIAMLGGRPESQVLGVEIDPCAYTIAARAFAGTGPSSGLLCRDFFGVTPGELPAVDAVVGNPPFIRYHRFAGEARALAMRRAGEAGVALSRLASSWAPFLVHAMRLIKPGGRLGMVLPAELMHAAYAGTVLQHVIRSFRTVRILTFSRRLFSGLSEETCLLLAEGFGDAPERAALVALHDANDLDGCTSPREDLPAGIALDSDALGSGHRRVLQYHLPEHVWRIYERWRLSPDVTHLGDVADVGIGYVTGDNGYFHLSGDAAAEHCLPDNVLRPAVRHGADLTGIRFTTSDWQKQHDAGSANLLLHIAPAQSLTAPLQRYVALGDRLGVPNRYKCRVRQPWYAVPHVHIADAFLTYMSGSRTKFVVNSAGVVSPNTLLGVHLRPTLMSPSPDPLCLAISWHTSLTALSCELEGHSLGGGMLKLEPTEASRVAIAVPTMEAAVFQQIAQALEGYLRAGRPDAANDYANNAILRDHLGFTVEEIHQLQEAAAWLRSRRLNR